MTCQHLNIIVNQTIVNVDKLMGCDSFSEIKFQRKLQGKIVYGL